MSFLRATTAFFIAFAVIFIKIHGRTIVEENIPQPSSFTIQDLNFDNFQLDNGRALSSFSYKVVAQDGNKQEWSCKIFAMPVNWSSENNKELNNSNFDRDKWNEEIRSKLEEDEKKQGLAESCAKNEFVEEGKTSVATKVSTIFFDLEKDSEGKWEFKEENIDSLLSGDYESSN